MPHLELLTQNGRNQFLGSCLAVCPRDTYHRNLELATVLAGELFVGDERIVNEYESTVARIGILLRR